MLRSHLHIALRSIRNHRLYAVINTAGLAIGMAACLLILLYVTYEKSFDDVPGADDVYRVENDHFRRDETVYNSAATFSGVGPAMKERFPDVLAFARLYDTSAGNPTVLSRPDAQGDPVRFREERVFYADASFIDLFSVRLRSGDPATALEQPNSVMLSASTARRYFGATDAMGRTLQLDDAELNHHLLTVTGVFEDAPPNTHVHYDILISYPTLYEQESKEAYEHDWGWYAFYTYVQLAPGADPDRIARRTNALTDIFKPSMKEAHEGYTFTLIPLRDIHLSSHLQNEIEANGSGTAVSMLLAVAFFILVIAWINYVNLATARSMTRAREVGVRKVLGSTRAQLARQFLLESLLTNVIALGLAVALVYVAEAAIRPLTGLKVNLWLWAAPWTWIALMTAFFLGALLAGAYPAFVLSRYRPARVLKGGFHGSQGGAYVRHALVAVQFVASIALITGTFAVHQQLHFMLSQDLGFDVDQTLVVEKPGVLAPTPEARQARLHAFKETLGANPVVKDVAASSVIPGKSILRGLVVTTGAAGNPSHFASIERAEVDGHFLKAYGMEVRAGRVFTSERSETDKVVLNASAARLLGFGTPQAAVGQDVFLFGTDRHTVIGVIADYHHESLRTKPDPMYFVFNPSVDTYFSIKMAAAHVPSAVADTRAAFEAAFPGNPFDYYFLDDLFDAQYDADRRFGDVFSIFSILAAFVACLGLFGLSAFMMAQRTKEVGIRKALGATTIGVQRLFLKGFARLVMLSGLVAWPLAYFGLDKWLASYAFRIELSWWLFLIPFVAVLTITLVTVGVNTLRAARANPAESLRYE